MNKIRAIRDLNQKELEAGISPQASWHADYRDTAYIYIGGLPFELSEGDIVAIFSQFGEPTYVNLIRDKETGKSRGFAFLKYEDQRSTDLAVDNLGGAVVMGRTLNVDHTRYKKKDDEPDEGVDLIEAARIEASSGNESDPELARPMLREEQELAALIRDHDDGDPMKAFLVDDMKDKVSKAIALLKDSKQSGKDRKSKHRHHHLHRSKDHEDHRDRRYRSSRDQADRSRRRNSRSPEVPHQHMNGSDDERRWRHRSSRQD